MQFNKIVQYLKTMSLSIVIMLLVAFGMATENSWIQYGSILIVIGGQMAYQMFKSIRSAPMLNVNMMDAEKAKSGKLLFKTSENEVRKIKSYVGDAGDMGISSKTLPLMFAPLIIFIVAGYLLGIIAPAILRWQSYLIAFFVTLPVSSIITIKMGVSTSSGPVSSPDTYCISEKGIVFEHMGRSFILVFPLKKLKVKAEKKLIEVEGQSTKSAMIPNKLRLFNNDVDQLQRTLLRFTETKTSLK